jgi:hypothetical protein
MAGENLAWPGEPETASWPGQPEAAAQWPGQADKVQEEIKPSPTIGGEILSGNFMSAAGLIRDKLESFAAPAQPSSALRQAGTEPGSLLGTNERIPYLPEDSQAMSQGKAIINWGNSFMAGLTGPEMVSAAPLALLPGVGQVFAADIATHLPERAAQMKEAEKTPPGSPQRTEAILGTMGDLLMMAGGAKADTALKPKGGGIDVSPKLREEDTAGAPSGVSGQETRNEPTEGAKGSSAPEKPITTAAAGEPASAVMRDVVEHHNAVVDSAEIQPGIKAAIAEIQRRNDPNFGLPAALAEQRRNAPAVQAPRLLRGEKQGDLISSTQAEDFSLVGEKGVDYGARQKESAAQAQAKEEARLKAENEQELLAGLEEHYTRSGSEFYDALEEAGGLPTIASPRKQYAGELKNIREAYHNPTRQEKVSYNKIFKSDAPDIDVVTQRMKAKGFNVDTPGDLLEMARERLRTGRPIHGNEAVGSDAEMAGFGPGAASIKEPLRPNEPTAKQLAGFAADIRTGNPSTFAKAVGNLSEQVNTAKQGVEKSANVLSNLAHGFKRLVWDPPTRTNFDRWVGEWDQTLQYNDHWIKQLGHELEKAVPDVKRQEAIYNWAAADGDEAVLKEWADRAPKDVKAGYKDALTLTDEEKRLANLQRGAYDEWLQRAVESGMLHEGVDNYLKRIVTKRPEVEDALRASLRANRFSTNFVESKRRFWDSMIDAEREGIRYDKRIRGQSLYAQSFEHAAINRTKVRQFFDSQTENGRPFAIVEGTGIPIEGKDQQSEALLVSPFGARNVRGATELAQQLRQAHPEWSEPKALAIAKEKILAEYEPLDAPAFKNWQWVHTFEDGKQVFVRGDALVHKSIAKQLKNAFVKQRVDWAEPLLKGMSFIKGSKLSLALFHNVHEGVNAAGHLTNPANLRPLSDYLEMPEIKTAMEAGLKLVGSAHEQAYFAEGAGSHGWPELVPVLGEYVKAFKDATFEDWIPRLKAEAYLNANKRNVSGGVTGLRESKKLSAEQNAVLTARQVNATFGELNYRQMMRDPRLQQALQGIFLAPDFGEAKIRHIGQAFTRYGSEQRMAIGVVAAGLYVGSRILNKALDDDYHWDKPFAVVVGDRQYTLRSLPGDMTNMFSNPRGFVQHRLSPGVANAMELLTKRDYRGQPVDWSDYVKDTLLAPVPISLTHRPGLSWKDNLTAAMGITPMPYRYESEVRKLVTAYKKNSGNPKLVHQVERAEKETLLPSDYAPMRDALRDGNTDAAKNEYLKLIEAKGGGAKGIEAVTKALEMWQKAPLTGSRATEDKFKKTLTPEQKTLYDKAKDERKGIYKEFQQMRRDNPIQKQVKVSQMSLDDGLQMWADASPPARAQLQPVLVEKLMKTRMPADDRNRIYRMIAGIPAKAQDKAKPFSISA